MVASDASLSLQVLNLSMGFALEESPLLDEDREDPLLRASPEPSSISQGVGPLSHLLNLR